MVQRTTLKEASRKFPNSELKWMIQSKDYEQLNYQAVFADTHRSTLRQLVIKYIETPIFINHLVHIDFSNLLRLMLGKERIDSVGNQIDNIEALCKINAPNLDHLSLNWNKIWNLKPIRKNRFKKLNRFSIQSNPITCFGDLSDYPFCALEYLILENRKVFRLMINQTNIFEDLSCIIKTQCAKIRQIGTSNLKKVCFSSTRMKQGKVQKMLRQKSSSIKYEEYSQG